MGTASPAKLCVVCGADCSHTQRVKDSRGRYYCKPCYEQALAKAKKQRGSAANTADDQERSSTSNWGGSLLDDTGAAESPGAKRSCPECDAALEPEAVLCVNCGYVLRAGKHITPEVVENDDAPSTDEGADQARTRWPIVIGVFSLVFAVFGSIMYGLLTVAVALTPPAEAGGPLLWAAGLVLYLLMLGLSVALGLLALGLFGRRAFAPVWLRYWAWSKIAVSIVYAIVGAIGLYERTPEQLEALGPIIIALFIVITLIWLLFWPVFLLLWLRRKRIRSEIATW